MARQITKKSLGDFAPQINDEPEASPSKPPVAIQADSSDPFASIRRPGPKPARILPKAIVYFDTEEQAENVKQIAERQGVSVSGVIRVAIAEFCARHGLPF